MAEKEDVRKAAIKKAEGKRPKAQREVAFVTRTLKTPKKPEVWDLMKAGGMAGDFDESQYKEAAKSRIFGTDPMEDMEQEYFGVRLKDSAADKIEEQAQQVDMSAKRDKAHLQAVMEGNPKARKQAELLQSVQRSELRGLSTRTPIGHEGYGEILRERIKAYDDALKGKWDGKTPRSGHGGAFKDYKFNPDSIMTPDGRPRNVVSDLPRFVKRKK